MNRRTDLPSHDDVQAVLKQLIEATGRPPTVLALAGQLGLANTSFRRHVPDVTADLTRQRSATPASPSDDGITPF